MCVDACVVCVGTGMLADDIECFICDGRGNVEVSDGE